METLQFEATQVFDAYQKVAETDAQTPSPLPLPASSKVFPEPKAQERSEELPPSSVSQPPPETSEVVEKPECQQDELDDEARFFVFHVLYVNPKFRVIFYLWLSSGFPPLTEVNPHQVEIKRAQQLQVAEQIRDKSADDQGDGKGKKNKRGPGRGGKKISKRPSTNKWYSKQGKSPSKAVEPSKGNKAKKSRNSKAIAKTPSPMKSGSPPGSGTKPKPKAKAKAKAKAKVTSPSKRKPNTPATPSKKKRGEQKKQEASKGSRGGKRKAENGDEPEISKASQTRAEKVKATFARRAAPKNEPSLTFWRTVRKAFEDSVEPYVHKPSTLEDPNVGIGFGSFFPNQGCQKLWMLRLSGFVSLSHEDPFWKVAKQEHKKHGDGGDLGEAATKWAHLFYDDLLKVNPRFLFDVITHCHAFKDLDNTCGHMKGYQNQPYLLRYHPACLLISSLWSHGGDRMNGQHTLPSLTISNFDL